MCWWGDRHGAEHVLRGAPAREAAQESRAAAAVASPAPRPVGGVLLNAFQPFPSAKPAFMPLVCALDGGAAAAAWPRTPTRAAPARLT